MKTLLISLIIILQMIAMPLSAAEAQTTQYRHPATGLIFPDSVEGIIRGNVTDFEGKNPGLGISVAYD
ncbi:MAG: hypothetical protein Q8K51_03525, partial [Nitrospirota bacterium]|nr:hypothetical protein [Nitrospirota bacterium]